MTQSRPAPGAIALVGSGEYLDVMNDTDAYLLETLGGASNVSVALLPTASGLEDGGPTYWNDLGVGHFQQLGVKDIRATSIINRQRATDPQQLELLRDVNFFYMSGGNPQHTIETLRDSPALEIMLGAHKHGAILAGCSAGAMALSAYTIALRQMMMGGKAAWVKSLAVIPNVVVFPHFDRMANFIDEVVFQKLLSTLPAGIIAVGVDENTALVRIDADASHWQVMGQQTVKVYQKGMAQRTLHVGDAITLAIAGQ